MRHIRIILFTVLCSINTYEMFGAFAITIDAAETKATTAVAPTARQAALAAIKNSISKIEASIEMVSIFKHKEDLHNYCIEMKSHLNEMAETLAQLGICPENYLGQLYADLNDIQRYADNHWLYHQVIENKCEVQSIETPSKASTSSISECTSSCDAHSDTTYREQSVSQPSNRDDETSEKEPLCGNARNYGDSVTEDISLAETTVLLSHALKNLTDLFCCCHKKKSYQA